MHRTLATSFAWVRRACVLAACLCLAAPPALAERGQFYVGLGGQWVSFHDGAYRIPAEDCEAEICVHDLEEDLWAYGAFGYDVTEYFSIELNVFDLDPEPAMRIPGEGRRLDADLYRLDLLMEMGFDLGPARPFIVAGFGEFTLDEERDEMVDLGLGLKFPITPRLDLRATLRSLHPLAPDWEDHHYGVDLAMLYYLGTPTRLRRDEPEAPEEPEAPQDSDGDGVIDDRDDCPDTPRNYAVDDRGCPIALEEVARIEIRVEFDFDRAFVKPEYLDGIMELADFLAENPELIVEVEGHTDSIGTDAYNFGLSARRAAAVRNVLVDRFGISPGRLWTTGYGESQPIASNLTAEGRAMNRRVIAVVTKTVQVYEERNEAR